MRVLLVAALVIVAIAYLVRSGRIEIHDRWNPWAPLHIADAPDLLTRFKLLRVSSDAALCRSVLREADLTYTPLPDRRTGEGCGFDNAVLIKASSVRVGAPFSLSCRAAVSLAMWERHVMQPAALRHLGSPVTRIEHFGSYACRNVGNRADSGQRSRHATADAIDIAGFVLADGRAIRVAQDWISEAGAQGDDAEARLLREVHAGACGLFSTVLGPAYNAAHRDHLHLDRGAYGICR